MSETKPETDNRSKLCDNCDHLASWHKQMHGGGYSRCRYPSLDNPTCKCKQYSYKVPPDERLIYTQAQMNQAVSRMKEELIKKVKEESQHWREAGERFARIANQENMAQARVANEQLRDEAFAKHRGMIVLAVELEKVEINV